MVPQSGARLVCEAAPARGVIDDGAGNPGSRVRARVASGIGTGLVQAHKTKECVGIDNLDLEVGV
jgi:hypothetical protein